MPPSSRRLLAAVDEVVRALAHPAYAHTSHLQIRVEGRVVVDEHFRGPAAGDVFSVTKSVVATAAGVVAQQGRLPDLDAPVAQTLKVLADSPARAHTWRHLLTMTRGAKTDGPWDVDELTAHACGLVEHIASAPQEHEPGLRYRYDDGGAHLVAAALSVLVDEPLDAFLQRELFDPLGTAPEGWREDDQRVPLGYAHLRISAEGLGRLGQLWLDQGCVGDRRVVDRAYLDAMLSPQSSGGAPEELPYGFLTWIDPAGWLAGGWAGQHVLVVPDAAAVVVTTGDPEFDLGPPPTDRLPDGWRPALDLVRQHVLPALH